MEKSKFKRLYFGVVILLGLFFFQGSHDDVCEINSCGNEESVSGILVYNKTQYPLGMFTPELDYNSSEAGSVVTVGNYLRITFDTSAGSGEAGRLITIIAFRLNSNNEIDGFYGKKTAKVPDGNKIKTIYFK